MLLWPASNCIAQEKKIPSLVCPLNDAVEIPAEKAGINFDSPEMKLVISSATDTLVKASADAVISRIQYDEDGLIEVVYYHRDYWFWISGLSKAVTRKDQKVKSGDVIGHLPFGKSMEILIYDFETPLDPKSILPCIVPKPARNN